jgi:DNA-binding IscR family transcriptional regulator
MSCRFAMAVHVLAVLAYKEGDRVSSALLASSVNTNPVIIRRLLLALQQAKLVDTSKGPGCGSRLSRSPARINLAEVYEAVKCEPAFNLPRRRANGTCPVGQGIGTVMRQLVSAAQEALEKELARKTLASILQEVKARSAPH